MHKVIASIAPILLGNNDAIAHQWQERAVAKRMHSNDRNAHQQLAETKSIASIAPRGSPGRDP